MKNKFSLPLIFVAAINLVLFIIKLYIGVRTNSLCIYTDSINNLMDTVSSVIAFISAIFINKASTKAHPFGFGRIEYILELVLSLIITFAGLYFAYTSIARLTMPTPVWFYVNFAVILGATALVKIALGFIFLKLYKRTKSVIFKAIMLDSFLDSCVTLVAIISFTLSNRSGIVLDGFLGLIISIMIIASGIRLIISSVSTLIGTNDKEIIKEIKAVLQSIDSTLIINNILINDYGTNSKYITLCLKNDNKDKLKLQNTIKEKLENNIYKKVFIEWEE